MNTFGPVVKALRSSSGFTLEHCSKKVGSHKGYWSGIENEKVNPPSVGITRKIFRLFAKKLEDLGVQATEQDLVELAWACKAPPFIRERAMHRIRGNPLARMEIVQTPAVPAIRPVPAQVELKPTAPPPEDADLLPSEKATG